MNMKLLLFLFPFLVSWLPVLANDFAAVNSYFLFALSASDRAAVLDAMKSANMKLLRVFITIVSQGNKGSSATAVNDLETVAVGSYDDAILRQIDTLASEAQPRGIKLVIAMHDRYALGCWSTDAYVKKYNLPNTGCNGVPDSSAFYLNSSAIADYDKRLRHILNFQSPKFGVPWKQLSSAIFAFEIENEAMGHMTQYPQWWCGRAKTIRSVLGNSSILVSTGGGTDIPTSTPQEVFSCPEIQLVALHDYNIDPNYVASNVDAAKASAVASGKRLLYEEFGATGSSKQSETEVVTNTLISTGVPWMYWELTKPGKGSADYEVWTDEPTWNTLKSQSLTTAQQGGMWDWPEIIR